MEQQCALSGTKYTAYEGTIWGNLRPNIRDFVGTVHNTSNYSDDTFISYAALNSLLRSYITGLATAELDDNKQLNERVRQRFENDETLQPLQHKIEEDTLSFGNRLSDKIAAFGGSWPFIILFFLILAVWMLINVAILRNNAFDPYPFILLNLVLSCLAAIQAPIIMMSQNRLSVKDRLRSEYDFKVNLKAETEVRLLHDKVDHQLLHQHKNIIEVLMLQVDLMEQLHNRLQLFRTGTQTAEEAAERG
jgi:uncharacterized membrane protein